MLSWRNSIAYFFQNNAHRSFQRDGRFKQNAESDQSGTPACRRSPRTYTPPATPPPRSLEEVEADWTGAYKFLQGCYYFFFFFCCALWNSHIRLCKALASKLIGPEPGLDLSSALCRWKKEYVISSSHVHVSVSMGHVNRHRSLFELASTLTFGFSSGFLSRVHMKIPENT